MNTLLALHQTLTHALQTDPLHQLALLVTTLDPLWQVNEDDLYEQEGDIELALLIARRVFPDVYVDILLQQRAGISQAELHRLVCEGFTQHGIPIDDVTSLSYGIPLTAYGLNLSDPDVYTHHPSLINLLSLFGVQVDLDSYDIDVPHATYKVGHLLADSLVQQDDPQWQQVGWLLAWVFSCSGNTLIDADDEELSSIQPLSWEADDVAFAQEMIAEAEKVLKDAEEAQLWLKTHPEAMTQLGANIQRTYKLLSQQKDKPMHMKIQLKWSA